MEQDVIHVQCHILKTDILKENGYIILLNEPGRIKL